MGMFARFLLMTWLVCGTAGSIYLLTKTLLEIALRVVTVRSQTCLEDTVWWPTWMMGLGCATCVIGLMGASCKVKLLQWFFNFLLNVGVLFVIGIMIWRMLMFGWLRKPILVSFNKVYNDGSPLDDEYRTMLIDTMASEHAWPKVEACMDDLKFCDEVPGPEKLFSDDKWNIEEFYEYYREGCCKAPKRCAQNLVKFEGLGDGDCAKWANSTISKPVNAKCYDCDSCKAARMATYQTNNDKYRMFSIYFAIFLFVASLFVTIGGFD